MSYKKCPHCGYMQCLTCGERHHDNTCLACGQDMIMTLEQERKKKEAYKKLERRKK